MNITRLIKTAMLATGISTIIAGCASTPQTPAEKKAEVINDFQDASGNVAATGDAQIDGVGTQISKVYKTVDRLLNNYVESQSSTGGKHFINYINAVENETPAAKLGMWKKLTPGTKKNINDYLQSDIISKLGDVKPLLEQSKQLVGKAGEFKNLLTSFDAETLKKLSSVKGMLSQGEQSVNALNFLGDEFDKVQFVQSMLGK